MTDEIDATHERWCDAYRRGDADAVLTLLTDDYRLWAPGREPITIADLEPRLRAAFETYDCSPSFERLELLAAGDLAIDVGWDTQRLTPRAGGAPIVQKQRVCVVLRRDPAGRWRYARGMVLAGQPPDVPGGAASET
ncbi:MAG: nuclear transport factor 2 family protein [Vicinamibacterales bacterium]